MDKRLEIFWDGRVPGLAEHRLSLDAFGQALSLLLVAYRRIANNLLAQATSDTGRLRSFAKAIDLELIEIKEGSSGISAACITSGIYGIIENEDIFQQKLFEAGLFDSLAGRAATALLADIEAEANGHARNAAVRNYLRALPEGLTGQKYTYSENGHSKEVTIGSMELPEGPPEMPVIHERLYAIVAVGFAPGESYVRLKGIDETVQCEATIEQVGKALELRFGSVNALIVRQGRKARLLRLRRAGEDLPPMSPEQEDYLIFGKWDELLRRLAK
ncbi:MAG: hypothetical protein JF614_20100 [Acidobacteria bacterium]|nr:hypothetical protein [Acidobacteriota bacterium]